jgi:hypothetical protein
MKHLLLSIAFLTLCIPAELDAQGWCPDGSSWTFDYTSSSGTYGYVGIYGAGDTLIQGKNCRKLARKRFQVPATGTPLTSELIGYVYTYENNGVVYIYDDFGDDFDTLFNFRARVGDRYPVAIVPASSAPIQMRAEVFAKGQMNIDGQQKAWAEVEYAVLLNNGNIITHIDTLIENIGPVSGYFFPVNFYQAVNGQAEGGNFRCYADQSPFQYKKTTLAYCDYINSAGTLPEANKFRVFPNPAKGQFKITGKGHMEGVIEIRNIHGTITGTVPMHHSEAWIPAHLPPGLYFLSIIRPGAPVSNLKIIKN